MDYGQYRMKFRQMDYRLSKKSTLARLLKRPVYTPQNILHSLFLKLDIFDAVHNCTYNRIVAL